MIEYHFQDDYTEGCHPRILELLSKSNLDSQIGYGDDFYSLEAKKKIRSKIEDEKAAVFFVSGGTQANIIVIAASLRPHESVISAKSGHIHIHEAGAIEATGHKINEIETVDGKLTVEAIQKVLDEQIPLYHTVKPKMVYISNSTEYGTIYYKSELEALSKFCKEKDMFLFMDGARLGSALCTSDCDLTMKDIARLTDVFYIGGTKNGALLGEAIVITNDSLKIDFPFHIKQRGAMLAKGRLLGIQFYTLFEDDLFFELAKHANKMAAKLKDALIENGYDLLINTTSNQIFPILPNALISKLKEKYRFHIWEKVDDDYSAVRWICSWATDIIAVETLVKDIKLE